ncbi:MAG TPA: hydroxymethylbilane synthase [Caldimonas sp.]|nr:hydroxymethylbilane synthase [Caldimonas sp.]
MPAPERLVIATRQSALALAQAEEVRAKLSALHPACRVEILGLTTTGDRRLDLPLADIGGKGLFIKELEQAMARGEADLAAHSLKDVPMELPEGFALPAILARDDPRDAFVSNAYRALSELPPGSSVGTSSLRREAQLRERYPRLDVQPLRGNVNTRLHRLDQGNHAAIVLAAIGLKRLGFAERITRVLEPDESLPAIGQGALALECRADRPDVIAALAPLADRSTTLAAIAERAFGRKLAGSCRTPLAAYAVARDGELALKGLVASRDGRAVLRGERSGNVATTDAARALGEALASEMIARGAAAILAAAS